MSVELGVRLFGSERDVTTLLTLSRTAPELVSQPWTEHELEDGYVLVPDQLPVSTSEQLSGEGVELIPAPTGRGRRARQLVEAVRPVPVAGEPATELAWFVMSADGPGPTRTLERLLLLGRSDSRVAELVHDAKPLLVIETREPPLYLLMRARDERGEGVRVYGSVSDSLLVEWGFAHPLPDVMRRVVRDAEARLLVDRDGRWRWMRGEVDWRHVLDTLEPRLDASWQDLHASPGERRFEVHVRLAPGPTEDAELWLFDERGFATLEPLVASAPSEDLANLSVCRLDHPGKGPCYLMRERARAGGTPLASRIGDLTGNHGYVRADGMDNLYLPVGKRLLPVIGRAELRELLAIEDGGLVIVDEDATGATVFRVRDVAEEPLSSWVDLRATERRVELDRMLEESLLEFPGIEIEPKPVPNLEPRLPRPRTRREPKPRARPAPTVDETVEAPTEHIDVRALRDRAGELETNLIEGGVTDTTTWRELADVKRRLGELDEAGICAEAGAFYSVDAGPREVGQLVELVRQAMPVANADPTELALEPDLSAAQASLLAGIVLEKLVDDRPLEDGLAPEIVRLFSSPSMPVSRRLAWLVLREFHRVTGDRLGITRAKEAVLGGINAAGLSHAYDVPRFVRHALALTDDAPGSSAQTSRGVQIALLDSLWRTAGHGIQALDPISAFKRVIFGCGYGLLGASQSARDLFEPLEEELPVHDAPTAALLRLYQARLASTTSDDAEAWAREVEAVSGRLDRQHRSAVQWFSKRSPWLSTEEPKQSTVWLDSSLYRLVESVEREPETARDSLALMFAQSFFDYQIEAALGRAISAVLGTGNDALMRDVARTAADHVETLSIPRCRAKALSSCIEAAAAAEDTDTVRTLLNRIVRLTRSRENVSATDLLVAVRPALLALRRLGLAESARGFLDALANVVEPGERGSVPLLAALAEGFLQQHDAPRAETRLNLAARHAVTDRVEDYRIRDENAAAVLLALRHWPVGDRSPICQLLLRNLDLFRDAFTLGRYLPTFKVLLLERIVAAVVDEAALSEDRTLAFLDEEELAIRRQIHLDCDELCGR